MPGTSGTDGQPADGPAPAVPDARTASLAVAGPEADAAPARCPVCGGVGWVAPDVPFGDPAFGKAVACPCMAEEIARRRLENLRRDTNVTLLADMTFGTFQVEAPGNSPDQVRSLRAAFEAARTFARQPVGWLLLRGSLGSGKTHLAASIVNERIRQGRPAIFVVVPDLLDDLRSAFSPDSETTYEARFDAVRDAPLLVLDDLGTQATTPWAAEKLFQILNHRYSARLPTVITTNCRLEDLDDRLRSRLGHVGVVRSVELRALDYRGGVTHEDTQLSSLHLYGSMTLEGWDSRLSSLKPELAANVRRAYEAARAYAESPSGWLVLLGDHGCGKTHLAAAIANYRISLGAAALFVVVPDLLDHLRATFSPSSRVQYDRRFDEVRGTALLVLDDLGVESATPWAQEKLFQILNHRYAAQLATVITMAMRLDEVPARLRSRMLDARICTIFEIRAPGYHESVPVPRHTPERSRRSRSR